MVRPQVAKNTVVRFFKGKRNINIHVQPVEVLANIGIEMTEIVRLSEALTIEMYEEGRLVGRRHIESPESPASEEVPATVRISYRFADWTGPEDVVALCRSYSIS